MVSTFILCVLLYSLYSFDRVNSAAFNVVGSKDEEQFIRLKSQYDLQPSTVVKLPIDVPDEYISLFGTLPPRLVQIDSPNSNGVYGAGDVVYIELEFTIPVYVSGVPTLTLNTGCHDSSCTTKEIQSFTCAADDGQFAVRFQDEFIMNVDANTTTYAFEKKLEELTGVNAVTVEYDMVDDRIYSSGNRICTSIGNQITVTFDDVDFPQFDGDVPPLIFDATNYFADLHSGLDIGAGLFLRGVNSGYRPYVLQSLELQQGVRYRDGQASYIAGNGTNLLTFQFIAEDGDFSEKLHVKSINFDTGYIFSPVTGANVSTAVPDFGAGRRYMSIASEALSYDREISITSAQPQIIDVSSSNPNQIYTQGDEVFVEVQYNLPIKLDRPNDITLQLATGKINRLAEFYTVLDETIIVFKYVVQQGDTSVRLDTVSSASLEVNDGNIFRKTSTNETVANVTLPVPGTVGSLSYNKNIIINTLTPVIISVGASSQPGVYTGGDHIDFSVVYDVPIHVTGTPLLLIQNTPRKFDAVIRAAPYAPEFTYERALAGYVSQIAMELSFNWPLVVGDTIVLKLADFRIESAADNVTLSISGTLSSEDTQIAGIWWPAEEMVVLELKTDVDAQTPLDIVIDARSGIRVRPQGVVPAAPSTYQDIQLSIYSAAIPDISATSGLSFSVLGAVGFENISLSVTTTVDDTSGLNQLTVPIQIVLDVKVPELLQQDDVIVVHMSHFPFSPTAPFSVKYYPDVASVEFNASWNNETSDLIFTLASETASTLTLSFTLTDLVPFLLPIEGVSAGSATVSLDSVMNGNIDSVTIPFITTVCSFDATVPPSVEYITRIAGVNSAVRFSWAIVTSDLLVGDTVSFILPEHDATLGVVSRVVTSSQLSGNLSDLFDVSIAAATVTFSAKEIVSVGTAVSLVLDASAGLVVPVSGVRAATDTFTGHIASAACTSFGDEVYFFDEGTLVVQLVQPSLSFSPGALLLDTQTELDFYLGVSSTMQTGDELHFYVPGFTRDIEIDPYNNSLISNADVDMYYDRAGQTIVFTFLSDFPITSDGSSIYGLNITVVVGQQFRTPSTSISPGDLTVSLVTAGRGAVIRQPIEVPCLGFCTGSAIYSTSFVGEMVSSAFSFSYSEDLLSGDELIFSLGAFVLPAGGSADVDCAVTLVSTSSQYSVTPVWTIDGSTGYLSASVALPVNIDAHEVAEILFEGIEFSSAAAGQTMAPTVSRADVALDGLATFSFDEPVVYVEYYFQPANMSYTALGDDLYAVQLYLELPMTLDLHEESYVNIQLGGFSHPDTLLVSDISGNSSQINIAQTTWTEATSLLHIQLEESLSGGAALELTVAGFLLPPAGVSASYLCPGSVSAAASCFQIAYSTGVRTVTSATFYDTGFKAFSGLQEVISLRNTHIAFEVDASDALSVTMVRVLTDLSVDIAVGDVLSLSLPSFISVGAIAAPPIDVAGFQCSAVWSEPTLSLTATTTHAAGTVSLNISTADVGIALENVGVSSSSLATLQFQQLSRAGDSAIENDIVMPCVGICTATITPAVRKAGYATSYVVRLEFGTFDFQFGDNITFHLNGFSRDVGTGASQIETEDGVPLSVEWFENSNELAISLYTDIGATYSELSFVLSQNFGLKSPVAGVRPSDLFDARWNAAAVTSATIHSHTVAVGAIGRATASSFTLNDQHLPGVASSLSFSFIFVDDVKTGDTLFLRLPEFVVPTTALDITSTTHAITAEGISSVTDVFQNVDNSQYLIHHLANIVVTMEADVSGGQELSFTISNSSVVVTPITGLYSSAEGGLLSTPKFALVSSTSPLATLSFDSNDRLGSLSPAALLINDPIIDANFSADLLSANISISLVFTVNCPWFEADVLSVDMPNLELIDMSSPAFVEVNHSVSGVGSASNDATFEASFANGMLVFGLASTTGGGAYISTGTELVLDISLFNFKFDQTIVYANSPDTRFSMDSPLCPIDFMPFESSSASFLKTSSLEFSALAGASSSTSLLLSLSLADEMLSGDQLVLTLPGFYLLCNRTVPSSTCILPVQSSRSVVEESALIIDDFSGTVRLRLILTQNLASNSSVTVEILSSEADSVILPDDGINGDGGVALQLERNGTGVVFSGPIQVVSQVAFFTSKSIVLDSVPAVVTGSASRNVGLYIRWSLNQQLNVGEEIAFYLGGFTRNDEFSTVSSVVLSGGTVADKFTAAWSSDTSILLLRALSSVSADFESEVYISSVEGFSPPEVGIPSLLYTYEIALYRFAAVVAGDDNTIPVLQLVESIVDITVVPATQAYTTATINFVSAEAPKALDYGGDSTIIQLEPGHEFTAGDSGGQLEIDGELYTIDTVANDLIYLLEPYTGSKVLSSLPVIPIYSPLYRVATFTSGSGTRSLVFTYTVRRGDSSASLSVFDTAGTKYSNIYGLQLNGGSLLRNSLAPAVVASLTIPQYVSDPTRIVNTDIPTIIGLSSSSPEGMYAIGQQLDFQVTFDVAVTVSDADKTQGIAPLLLLRIKQFGRVTARYSSGSSTDTLVFVYTVNIDDQQHTGIGPLAAIAGNESLLSTEHPIFQPLRVIANNRFEYIRRASMDPLLDVNIFFDKDSIAFSIPNDIILSGNATKVISMSVPENSRGGREYTAGDQILLYVEFSDEVVINGDGLDDLFVELETGRLDSSSAIAQFVEFEGGGNSGMTLIFAYEIQEVDSLSDGLFLHCTCLDYFERSVIQLNGSTIETVSTGQVASVILANSSSPEDRLIESVFVIDNTVPHVLHVTGNFSLAASSAVSDLYARTTGDVALINVAFSSAVTVFDSVRLMLRGASSNTRCPAHYYSGNNSDTLSFVYVMSYQSGTSRLDCSGVDAVDLSLGSIRRLADRPVIEVDVALPRPGTEPSLGIRNKIAVDNSAVHTNAVYVHGSELPFTTASSIGVNLYNRQSTDGDDIFQFIADSESVLDENTTMADAELLMLAQYEEQLLLQVDSSTWSISLPESTSGEYYSRLLFSDSLQRFYRFTSLYDKVFAAHSNDAKQTFLNYWWTGYSVQRDLDIELTFDRPVSFHDVEILLDTSPIDSLYQPLSLAQSSQQSYTYFLRVTIASSDERMNQYRISYGGHLSRCISVRAPAQGVDSVEEALRSIEKLAPLRPLVKFVDGHDDADMTFEYSIEFDHLPNFYSTFEVVGAEVLGEACYLPSPQSQLELTRDTFSLVLSYPIRGDSSVVLTAQAALAPGTYALSIGKEEGITVSSLGLPSGSLSVEQFASQSQKLVSAGKLPDFIGVPQVMRSAIGFAYDDDSIDTPLLEAGMVPNRSTAVVLSMCFNPPLMTGDVVSVHLPGFVERDVIAVEAGSVAAVSFTEPVLSLSLLAGVSCLQETVTGLRTAEFGFFENSDTITFSVTSATAGNLVDSAFDFVQASGFRHFSIELSDARPGFDTHVVIKLDSPDGYEIDAGSVLSVCLPGFTSSDYVEGPLTIVSNELVGDYSAQWFTAQWLNETQCIEIESLVNLAAGALTINISAAGGRDRSREDGVDDSVVVRGLRVAVDGLSALLPPTVAFASEQWSSDFQSVTDFPLVLGHDNSIIQFNFTYDASIMDNNHIVHALEFSVNLAQVINGPATLELYLPSLTYFQGTFTRAIDGGLGGSSQLIAWRNADHILTIPFPDEETPAGMFTFSLEDLTGFAIDEAVGIPIGRSHMTFGISASNGALAHTPIHLIDLVPTIQESSVVFSRLNDDAFTKSPLTITIRLELNMAPAALDVFSFYLDGFSPMVNAYVVDDPCAAIIAPFTDGASLQLMMLNNTNDCWFNATYKEFTVVSDIADAASLDNLRSVVQYNTNTNFIAWSKNLPQYESGKQLITKMAPLGITSSSLVFSNPLPGHRSDVTLSVLTASAMAAGDSLVLTCDDELIFNFTGDIQVADNVGNIWTATFDAFESTLSLRTSTDLPPSALSFVFVDALGVGARLPDTGVLPGPNNNAFAITLSRSGTSLLAQAVQFITPVGYISSFALRPSRLSVAAAATSSEYQPVSLDVAMTTSAAVNVGDRITFFLSDQYMIGDATTALTLSGIDGANLDAVTDPTERSIVFTVVGSPAGGGTTLEFNVDVSYAIQVSSAHYCSEENTLVTTGECSLRVSIESSSCPVSEQVVPYEEIVIFDSVLSFYMLDLVPSQFPTPTPTMTPPTNAPNVDAANPTSQPSNMPSNQPSVSPSSQPSSQPTTRPTMTVGVPTFAPTARPTGAYASNYFVMELSFVVPSGMLAGDIIEIYIPSLTLQDDAPADVVAANALNHSQLILVQTSREMTTADWLSSYSEDNHTVFLEALSDIATGPQTVTVGSTMLQLANSLSYTDDTTITFKAMRDDYVFEQGHFTSVKPFGLAHSALTLSSYIPGTVTGLVIDLLPVSTGFEVHDIVDIYLPGFALSGGGSLAAIPLSGSSASVVIGSWDNSTEILRLIVVQEEPLSISVVIHDESNNMFVVPSDGCNINDVTISIYSIADDRTYGPGPMTVFPGVAPSVAISLSLIDPVAGLGADLQLTFTSTSLSFETYSVFDIFLPTFWSTHEELVVTGFTCPSGGSDCITATWFPCSEIMRLQSFETVLGITTPLSLTVSGLRVPLTGVPQYVAEAVTMAANTSVVGVLAASSIAVEQVGVVRYSELVFTPRQLNTVVSMDLIVELSDDILPGATLTLVLPGLDFQSTTPIISNAGTSAFDTASWAADSFSLVLSGSSAKTRGQVRHTITFDAAVKLPDEGLPQFSADTYVISSTTSNAIIGQTALQVLPSVGLISGHVEYFIVDRLTPVEVSLHFFLSDAIVVGDQIVFELPALFAAADITELTITGDLAELLDETNSSSSTAFTASFDAAARTVTLEAVTAESARGITVFVSAENGLLVDAAGNASLVHTISGNLSAIGAFANRVVDYSPTSFGSVSHISTSVIVSDCTSAGTACQWEIEVVLDAALAEGESIAIGHNHLFRHTEQVELDSSDAALVTPSLSKAVVLGGTASANFAATWRAADDIDGLKVLLETRNLAADNVLQLPSDDRNAALDAQTDFSGATPANVSLNAVLGNSPVLNMEAIIATSLPRITKVYIRNAGPYGQDVQQTMLLCEEGDSIEMVVEFNMAVTVLLAPAGAAPSIMLNTGERAVYASGNGTSSLVFVYFLEDPAAVQDIQILGPGAMESTGGGGANDGDVSAAPPMIVQTGRRLNVVANTTIPEPYSSLLLYRGAFVSVGIECSSEGEGLVGVRSIEAYSLSHHSYAAGNAIDIAVVFDRPVYAQGQPTLLLAPMEDRENKNMTFRASFVNVSRVQWLDIGIPVESGTAGGFFALSYEGVSTPCIPLGDNMETLNQLTDALYAIDALLPSWPITVQSFATNFGFRYKLIFGGRAPFLFEAGAAPLSGELLEVDAEYCGGTTVPATISADPTIADQIIVRYFVEDGDAAEVVVAQSLDALELSLVEDGAEESAIFLLGKTDQAKLNLTLPGLLSAEDVLSRSGVRIDTTPPVVNSVFWAYYDVSATELSETLEPGPEGASISSGDTVYIVVNFTSAVDVFGDHKAFELRLNFTSVARNLSWAKGLSTWREAFIEPVRDIPFVGVVRNQLVFRYDVQTGDAAEFLDTGGKFALIVNSDAGSVLLRSSLLPLPGHSLFVPAGSEPNSLFSQNLLVNATDVPVILSVTTNHSAASSMSSGEEVYVNIHFSSLVLVHEQSLNISATHPHIDLQTPSTGTLQYISGSGTTDLLFLYNVTEGDVADEITFYFDLLDAYLEDAIRNQFSSYSGTLRRLYILEGLVLEGDESEDTTLSVNTIPAGIVRVDVVEPDGTYRPGSILDVLVRFTKPVVAVWDTAKSSLVQREASGYVPSPNFDLFVPSLSGADVRATYWYGNGTTELHFKYFVPSWNPFMPEQAPMQLDYSGTAALQRALNGAIILDLSSNSYTEADIYLPTADRSHLIFNRDIYIDLSLARITGVELVVEDGHGFELADNEYTYTAGDDVLIAVKFNAAVMVYRPPVLKLSTAFGSAGVNRSAEYDSGNYTDTLFFRYAVQSGDQASILDYVDTRRAPYNTLPLSYTLPLSFDVHISSLRLEQDTGEAIITYPSDEHGGIFMASPSYEARTAMRLPTAMVSLPLPGTAGSLSEAFTIRVDTSAPYVTRVTSTLPDGSYGTGTTIPIIVTFNAPVAIGGCPKIKFRIHGRDKFASYLGGSGTQTIYFEYVVSDGDYLPNMDYFDRWSFVLDACNTTQLGTALREGREIYVKRAAAVPTIDANLTMPWLNYVESVIAPVSMVGGGKHITLTGANSATPRLVWTAVPDNSRVYALGDVIDINIGFGGDVVFSGSSGAFLRAVATDSRSAAAVQRDVYYAAPVNSTTVLMPLVVQYGEDLQELSYESEFALRTSVDCAIVDLNTGLCAAQNIPAPFGQLPNARDSFSPKRLSVLAQPTTPLYVTRIAFEEAAYRVGFNVDVRVTFSGPVVVRGMPVLTLFLDTNSLAMLCSYNYQLSPSELIFTVALTSDDMAGNLQCTRQSEIDLNGGSILREANFMPLLTPSELSLWGACCVGDSTDESIGDQVGSTRGISVTDLDDAVRLCTSVAVPVSLATPSVVRVYSNQTGVFSTGEEITIYAKFSGDLRVEGRAAYLELDLPGIPFASFAGIVDGNTLAFTYTVTERDFTSSLDYYSINSLVIDDTDSTSAILLDSDVGTIHASLLLPNRGAVGSLGRESDLVINNDRPNLVALITTPTQATSGDVVSIVLRYSEPMNVYSSTGEAWYHGSTTTTLGVALSMTTVTGSTETRTATLQNASGTDLSFVYQVTGTDPTATVYFASSLPLLYTNAFIKSVATQTNGPSKFADELSAPSLFTVDNDAPVVLRVYSLNASTAYPFGVGDVIDIYVEMSLSCVVVGAAPTLSLVLDGTAAADGRTVATAFYVPTGEASVKTLLFQYRVLEGDFANALEYRDIYALDGYLLRFSTFSPSIVADLTLPEPGLLGSLGFCCNLQVDSSAPYIKSLVPLKREGIYGENEQIVVQARFNKPVAVYGQPMLELSTGRNNRVGYANYTPTATVKDYFYDLAIDLRDTDVLFTYYVQRFDNVLSLVHSSPNAIKLSGEGGAAILHKTNSPELAADVSLREPGDFSISEGAVNRQWKFRFPSSVELLLRDFYHTKPDSLEVSMEHLGKSAVIFSGCCTGMTAGHSYAKSRSGTNAVLQQADTGVGSDYFFADTQAPNVALQGFASQSSTRVAARKAIDGNVDPLIGNNAVSDTNEEDDPWWMLSLPSGTVLQSINIFSRKPQSWIDPVVEVVVKGLDAFPVGFFKLRFSNIDEFDSTVTVTTGYLTMGIEETEAKVIIEQTTGIGNVLVSRRTLAPCLPNGGGCGVGVNEGKGFAYALTFRSLRVATPVVEVVDVEWQGQSPHVQVAPEGEYIDYDTLPVNVYPYQLETAVEVLRSGYYIQVPEVPEYGKGVTPPQPVTAVEGENEWLTPYYVFLFEEGVTVPVGLNDSIAAAVWFTRRENIDTLANFDLPLPIAAGSIKIQREGYGSLSLAEVELYTERLYSLQSYDRGSPIAPSYLTSPYQPFEPFAPNFNNLQFDGRWLIQLSQDSSLAKDHRGGWSGAYGTISEAVLVITDLAGTVHSYYQDLRAELTSLPKFGSISTTSRDTSVSAYADWREAFEVAADGTLSVRPGHERHLGYCYGRSINGVDNFDDCAQNFGVGPPLDDRVIGATPERNVFLRKERVVIYTPNLGYIGPDVFTYQIHDGLGLQSHISSTVTPIQNEVTVHVRKCRRFQSQQRNGASVGLGYSSSAEAEATHSLCSCAQTEHAILGDNITACDNARTALCSDEAARPRLLFMCLPCFDALRGLSSGDCRAQTLRAVSLITSRGLCSDEPPMDCSNEIITAPSKEKVSYLTLKPPMLYGFTSRSKNGFGGQGWFTSPLHA